MRIMKYVCFLSLLIWMMSCKSNPYESLPVLKLVDNENKLFTFTNKTSGFFIGNSHQENGNKDLGWTVNDAHYLNDYRIYADNIQIRRDSLLQFNYYPFSFIRNYKIPITERFTLLDSINAIVWEFDLAIDVKDFRFEPLLHHVNPAKTLSLNASSSEIILSPGELSPGKNDQDFQWMGFNYISNEQNKVVVLCALESNQYRLNWMLERLSKTYEDKINERINRITSLIEINNTYTNIPEITEALTWAQLSLDALLTEQNGKGIWAGLPWFNNYYSRDSFISSTGALLVSGKFEEARTILESFGRIQLQNENDTLYGRIPNCIANQNFIYNQADCTWWFIREVYEYLLYSGDTNFVQKIYPVIKKAIKGAIRYRIDEKFFLVHNDTDTWMDAVGPEGAHSPRGNRAIEIQSLWYTALQIGSIFAGLNDEDQLKEHWLAISQTLRKNFTNKYWSHVYNRAYDHLNKNGMPDRVVRPNQIFAVSIPRLPGIEPLLTEDKCARITNEVVHKLTYRYGVASLWQEDENFHPHHHNSADDPNDESIYNGTISTWLAGPVISSMIMLNRHELAFNLFYNEATQILWDDPIGNLAGRRDAFPRSEQIEPVLSGSISQALSLAEFIRNFYEDYIGYQPNAIENRIKFYPKMPVELRFISTQLPFAEDYISFTYTEDEKHFYFEFSMSGIKKRLDIIFEYPGFDEIKFQLNPEQSSYTISLDAKMQRYYYTHHDLEWYFAQPKQIEDQKALQKQE